MFNYDWSTIIITAFITFLITLGVMLTGLRFFLPTHIRIIENMIQVLRLSDLIPGNIELHVIQEGNDVEVTRTEKNASELGWRQ